jgi:hypothetical protein
MSHLHTYLGPKGYILLKKDFSPEEIADIREDLTARPFVKGAPVQEEVEYKVYRESANQMFIPRYYGESRFGKAKQVLIDAGQDIDTPFSGQLRENQVPVVTAFMKHIGDRGDGGGGGLLELPCAYGKCLGKDTPILMFDGSVKPVQDVVVGDLIMGDDSTPRKVHTCGSGIGPLFNVKQAEGNSFVCNDVHILCVQSPKGEVKEIEAKEYAASYMIFLFENCLYNLLFN